MPAADALEQINQPKKDLHPGRPNAHGQQPRYLPITTAEKPDSEYGRRRRIFHYNGIM
jgi:hypothetical protein